ncbi:MAG: hypothetical protein KF855_11710 [Acidobacteria bacterium]|nr:hypothetical protein [Acidobacteriota bacterium]
MPNNSPTFPAIVRTLYAALAGKCSLYAKLAERIDGLGVLYTKSPFLSTHAKLFVIELLKYVIDQTKQLRYSFTSTIESLIVKLEIWSGIKSWVNENNSVRLGLKYGKTMEAFWTNQASLQCPSLVDKAVGTVRIV